MQGDGLNLNRELVDDRVVLVLGIRDGELGIHFQRFSAFVAAVRLYQGVINPLLFRNYSGTPHVVREEHLELSANGARTNSHRKFYGGGFWQREFPHAWRIMGGEVIHVD